MYSWTDSLDEGQIEMVEVVGNLVLFHLGQALNQLLTSVPCPILSPPVDFAFFGSNEIENEIKNCVSGRKGEGEAEQMGKWRLLWSLRYQNGLLPLNYF